MGPGGQGLNTGWGPGGPGSDYWLGGRGLTTGWGAGGPGSDYWLRGCRHSDGQF